MNQDIIKTVTEFGLALVESQHKYFIEKSLDNMEHIPVIKGIADAAYQYLVVNGISSADSSKVKEELIHHGKDLFLQLWLQGIVEEGDIPTKKDRIEAEKTFERILKTGKDEYR